MNICIDCGKVGGSHSRWCASRVRSTQAPTEKPRQYRIERAAGLTVYVPIKPVKP